MNYISLYSGCGGADIGFLNQGFNHIGAFDINNSALEVLKLNLKVNTHKVDLSKSDILPLIGQKDVSVVFSGAPCQGFSTAGNRLYSDPRNNLLIKGGEIALSLKTNVFVSENVMGSLSGNLKEYWDYLDKMFIKSGYKTEFHKVNCLDLGMAQMRKRVLFFAWKGGKNKIIWKPKENPKALKDVINNINGSANNTSFIIKEDQKIKIANKIGVNQKLCNVRGGLRAVPTWDIPEVFGEVEREEKEMLILIRDLRRKNRVRDFGDADAVELKFLAKNFGANAVSLLKALENKGYVKSFSNGKYDLTRTFNGKYRRLSMDEPCPTVDTRFGNPIYFLHPTENRGFTIREAARIQGFPDEFIFKGSTGEVYKMIGNAVPPPLATEVARIVKEQLL